jgi:hypothetical protein
MSDIYIYTHMYACVCVCVCVHVRMCAMNIFPTCAKNRNMVMVAEIYIPSSLMSLSKYYIVFVPSNH